MNPYNILSLFGIDTDNFDVDPTIEHDEFCDYIYVKEKDSRRVCPVCGSLHCHIDAYRTSVVKHSIISRENRKLYIKINKIKYKCMDCNHRFYRDNSLVQKRCQISNEIHWEIYEKSKLKISFNDIAKLVQISPTQVINIFDKMVSYKRRKLTRCISIDEKKFINERGKYITVISNAENGQILDVVAGRSNQALMYYFSKIPQKELDLVEFLTSDMYEGFRTIKETYFPKAIHIIDHFHVSRLFTDAISRLRINYMNRYSDDEDMYNLLKKNWKKFLENNFNKKYKYNNAHYFTFHGIKLTFFQLQKHIFIKCPKLAEICNIYDEFNACFYDYHELPIVEENLKYIIQKSKVSNNDLIMKIGETLENFYYELCNTFSVKNKFRITNAVAEGNNSFIDKIIKLSFGMHNFKRFRNRIMHIKREKNP